jgi:hypothetical protein
LALAIAGTDGDLDTAHRRKRTKYFSEEQYRAMSHTALVQLCISKDRSFRYLHDELKAARRRLSKNGPEMLALGDQDEGDADDDANVFGVHRAGRAKRYFAVRGHYAMAIRRNLSNIAAKDLGSCIMDDIGGQTVCRSEEQASAAQVAAFRRFHQACEEDFPLLAIHAIRSDATNSNVWHQSKLFGLELTSTYLTQHAASKLTSATQFSSLVRQRKGWADVQRVLSGSAAGTHAMIRKQISGLGCPLWPSGTNFSSPFSEASVFARLFLITSDGGSDQKKARDISKVEVKDAANIFVVDISCVQHSNALIYKGNLSIEDQWLARLKRDHPDMEGKLNGGYYSNLAKMMHVWRGDVRHVYNLASRVYGNIVARASFKRLPPKPLAGRWGQITACEDHVLSATRSRLRVLLPIICGRAPAAADATAAVAAAVSAVPAEPEMAIVARVDDPRLEEQQAHRARVGRWKKDVVIACDSDLFWEGLLAHRRSSYPLDHHLRAVQQNPPVGTGRLGRLLGRVEGICDEAAECFRDVRWAAALVSTATCEKTKFLATSVLELQVQLSLHTAGGYWRRHVVPLSE